MLRFAIFGTGPAGQENRLAGAYLVGSDGVPLRGELEQRDRLVCCAKRADGPAGLALLWPVPRAGELLLETSRLMERDKFYNLSLELARGRLMRIAQKREDWGLFDFDGIEPVAAAIDKARDLFVEAMKTDSLEQQAKIADESLQLAIVAGEQLSQFHASIFLARRKQTRQFTRRTIGCSVDLANTSDAYRAKLRESFDYVCLPIPWQMVEPKQGEYNWRPVDAWVEWLAKNRIPIRIGPLVSFHETNLPAWVGMYETDFEAVRNLLFEYVRHVVERYGNYVYHWDVISGIHAENTFNFNFEQLMEITRVTASLVKQLAPRAATLIDITAPWGEYYARNQRTIPPMLYADMIVQSGIVFDGIGVQMVFGAPAEGMLARDLFQISEKLDRLGNLGKPVHITATQVPSSPVANGKNSGGWWHEPWNESVQAAWLKDFYAIALSKPFVESVTWMDLADRPGIMPSGGLLRSDMKPKAAFKTLSNLRNEILATQRKPPGRAARV